jgi:acyl-CoA dehydrogenase
MNPEILRRAAPDPVPIEAFLDPEHMAFAARLADLAGALGALPPAETDAEGRTQAREILETLAGAGWYAPVEAEDLRSCCLIREALGAASPLADAVFALQALGTTPLLLAAESKIRERWAGPAMRGELMAAFAMTEPEAGSDVAALSTRAVSDGSGWVLNGRKTLISNAGIADFYVVFAATDPAAGTRGISCFLVPSATEGLIFAGPQVLSAPHPLGELELVDCRIPADHRIGDEGAGFKIGMATLDRLRPTVGAAACGMAARALEEALHHAGTRKQFGQPLAEFQVIQEKLGRMYTNLMAGRLLVYQAAWARDRGAERITVQAAVSKSFATEAAQDIIDEAVQIVGGRGVLKSHPVDRLYRSVRALRIYEGTTEIQRMITARHLLSLRSAETRDVGP